METDPRSNAMAPKIAIIGAGPGGCMLARLLHQHSVPCTIFEGEISINYRSQGGTLDLRTNTGLAAVKQAGLWDEFQKHARYDGESLLITDKVLTTWLRRKPGRPDEKKKIGEAPEIDRSALRQMLMESVPEGTVKWGYKLTKVQETTTAGLELCFANGEVERGFDLIVGADGTWSKTRTLLSSDMPYYSGLAGWSLRITDPENAAPEVYKFVNRGSVFAYSDGRGLFAQQLGDGNIDVSAYTPFPEDYTSTCGFDINDLAVVKQTLKKVYHDWAPELLSIIDHCDSNPQWRSLYQFPVGWTWPHQKGITLLGDAAHVMTPFAGIGVNTAFFDAMELTKQIVAFTEAGEGAELDDYVVKYEKAMFVHAHKAQATTEGAKNDMLFTPGAPRTSIERWIMRHVTSESPAWTHPLLAILVYVSFWIYKFIV
jgi:2-polyprenyl-6-methoxyphenol hydroxylase-like FAD-dependent oxidoreductase